MLENVIEESFFFFAVNHLVSPTDGNISCCHLTVCSMSAVKETNVGNGSSALTVALVSVFWLSLFPPAVNFADCLIHGCDSLTHTQM